MPKLPKPSAVRFQTSQRGVRFATLKDARADFFDWLTTGVSPAGADTRMHIWQNGKERVVEKIGDDPKGEILRAVIRRALHSGRLRIQQMRTNRK